MPPKRASARRKKSSPPIATTDHESPPPEVETGANLAVAVKVEEKTESDSLPQVEASNPNPSQIDGDSTVAVGFNFESVKEDVNVENYEVGGMNEARIENVESDVGSDKVKEDVRLGSEDVDEVKQGVGLVTNEDGVVCVENDESVKSIDNDTEDLGQRNEKVDEEKAGAEAGKDEDGVVSVVASQSETVAEISSTQEEMAAVRVEILDDNNTSLVVNGDNDKEKEEIAEVISAQESNINKSPCKNNDAIIVEDCDNGGKKGTPKIISTQESSQAIITKALEDDSKENGDDEDNEGDDTGNEGDEGPSQFAPDNKKDKDVEIYVGRLDKSTVEDDLVKVFQRFGELKSTRIVRNSTTKKSKGFAFVQFVSVDHAKRALSELKDGFEVRGKRVMISASQDNDTLYLGNICKTWKQEEVLQQLKAYGIENIKTIRLPEDIKSDGKTKGFAFLEFKMHSDAVAAFQRLRKPDAVFGRDLSAKVSFAQTPLHSNDDELSQVKRVYLEGLTKDWNEEKVKEICNMYGEIVEINLCLKSRNKQKYFGFVTFTSNESAIACVKGINSAAIGGDVKVKANIAKPQQKSQQLQKKGFVGGFKVDKQSEVKKEGANSKGTSEPNLSKTKGGLNSPQAKKNRKDSSKNKVIAKPQQKESLKKPSSGGELIVEKQSKLPQMKKTGESSKEAESSKKTKSDSNSQQANRKRKGKGVAAPSDSRHGDQGTPKKQKNNNEGQNSKNNNDQGTLKKQKNNNEGQNSKNTSKAGNRKRKNTSKFEGREDTGNRNTQNGKKPFKKPKGNMHGRERDNYRNPRNDTHSRKGHDDYRISTRYIDPYVPQYVTTSDAYHMAHHDSLSARRLKAMEPHAGYIEPSSASVSRLYSGYVAQPPVVRTHNPHQTMYYEPASTSQSQSQSQSQLHSRYLDRSVMSQSHRSYMETAAPPAAARELHQSYTGYRQPAAVVQIAHDPYVPTLPRAVRHDARSSGVVTYGGGPALPAEYALSASRVQDQTSYYQGGGSYSGAYTTSQRRYY